MTGPGTTIDPNTDIILIEELMLTNDGRIEPISADIALSWFTQEQISAFCFYYGLYTFPTVELIEFLKKEMDGLTIEICAGNGVIGRALGIQMFDNHLQERDYVLTRYKAGGQIPVTYGSDVINLDGLDAIKQYSPKTVIASWCTSQWNGSRKIGNMYGIDEQAMFRAGVDKYIHIGNEKTHNVQTKPILRKYEHRTIKEPWILSRSMSRELNVIHIF